MRIQKKNKHTTAIVICLTVIVACALTGYLVYAHNSHNLWPFKNNVATKSSNNSQINYSPPTKQEIESSQDGKKNGVGKNNSNTTGKAISVVVSYAGLSDDKTSIEIDSYTPDVIEGDGVCTATLTKNSLVVTGQSQAAVDASSSICRPILIPLSKFGSNGTWSLTVSYKSTGYSGISQPQDVEVTQ